MRAAGPHQGPKDPSGGSKPHAVSERGGGMSGAPEATLPLAPGRILKLAPGRILRLDRDDISTDEITPVAILSYYDERLARFSYTGFTRDGAQPLGPGAVQAGGYTVTVAGKRYGKGSSREHSPRAEQLAGIRLVIAESFERLYRQNADNIGLLTSTDLSLADRIAQGDMPDLEALLAGR